MKETAKNMVSEFCDFLILMKDKLSHGFRVIQAKITNRVIHSKIANLKKILPGSAN